MSSSTVASVRNNQLHLRRLLLGGVTGFVGAILASLALIRYKKNQFRIATLKSGNHEPVLFKSIEGEDARDMVIIMGWGGSTKRQLSRIVEFYSKQLKMDVILFIQPMLEPADFLRKFLEFVRNNIKLESRRQVVLHIFSQNGASTLGCLLGELFAPNRSEETERFRSLFESKVHKVVFDSCPVEVEGSIHKSLRGGTRAMTAILLGRAQYHHPVLSTILYGILWFGHLTNPGMEKERRQRIRSIRRHLRPELVSMLFLYSTKDELIPSNLVENFIDSAKKQGFKTESLRFKDSAHIVHFKDHPEQYGSKVEEFVLRDL
eukprot:TRINITY_DN3733_c0_g2_i1.p1 TRINITY_DN3733_c0_g2~~TRINITY_DN3733_c0_g2_i1.p1  ORF type:complete len:319 (+),score=94.90 TRINITY_DN3733_c0_g2_i1:85-1041(+)